MTNLNALVSSQQSHATNGGHFLGSLVWWSLNGNRVSHTHLQDLAVQYGLPQRYLPAEVKPASAFRRAWRHASTKLSPGLLLRQIDDTSTGIHIGLVKEQADADQQELQYEQLTTIAFSKEFHSIQANDQHAVVGDIHALYTHHLELTTRDIRTMLSNFVKEAGVSLRESGGVYFIAASHQITIDAMTSVLAAIGHNQLHQLPLYNSPLAQDVLNGVAVATLDEEIHRLGEELQTFMADQKTRKSTLHKRLNSFDDLRSRVNTFAGVLSFQADALLETVAEMETGLRQHLGLGTFGQDTKTEPQDQSNPPSPNSSDETPDSTGASPGHTNMPSSLAFCSPYDSEVGF